MSLHPASELNFDKWWGCPETRSDALEEAKYYMWCGNTYTAYRLIVALCVSADKKGSDKYDESLEEYYQTVYQRQSK